MSDSDDTIPSESLVTIYDELRRHNEVLLESSEPQFVILLNSISGWRQSWENLDLECKRLSLELVQKSQEVKSLQQKLDHARCLVDKEVVSRKTAEEQRDQLSGQLQQLRQLVLQDNNAGQLTSNNIHEFDIGMQKEAYSAVLSPGLMREARAGWMNTKDVTEQSIHTVDEFSFDDTVDLCESKTRAGNDYKRSYGNDYKRRSGNDYKTRAAKRSYDELLESVMNDCTTPKACFSQLSDCPRRSNAKRRRSRSAGLMNHIQEESYLPKGGNEPVPEPTASNVVTPRTRASSAGSYLQMAGSSDQVPKRKDAGSSKSVQHNLYQKTVFAHELCTACKKRIKFGKISLKCRKCKTCVHTTCSDKVHPICDDNVNTSPTIVRKSPNVYYTRSKRDENKKQRVFASPMLR